jgi:ATPase subunit of ABC transporter with duplicated ATPase domains
VAVALWLAPELLVLDEPTNHLDRPSRQLLAESLERFDGIGLLVSHDRELLDRLCSQCLFLETHGAATLRPGGVSRGLEERERDRLERSREFESARSEVRRVEAESSRRRETASVAHQNRKRSKHGLSWKDSDAREKIDRARISGSDGQAGRLLNQLDGRARQARERLAGLERPIRERVGISVHGKRSKRDAILLREEGELALPDGRVVRHPRLEVRGTDRIALEGPNGAGKTTLVSAMLRDTGTVAEEVLWIPQELSAAQAEALVERARALDSGQLGRVISTVSRLGSDPGALLETAQPSPGEARKLMLALGLEREPSLVIMDEPTNHLDLVSIQCLEEALAEFAGALLLVSHDAAFIAALATTYWVIDDDGKLYVNDTRPV